MHFLYYLPGRTKDEVTPELVRSLGLGRVLEDCLTPQRFSEMPVSAVHAHGPDEGTGVILSPLPTDGTQSPGLGYLPDRQEWRPVSCPEPSVSAKQPAAAADEPPPVYWFGWFREQPPAPHTLRRHTPLIEGYELELADGQLWHCPTLRLMSGLPNLPCSLGINSAGSTVAQLLPAYEQQWQMAGEIFDRMAGQTEFTVAEGWQYAARLLQINYRLGLHEVSALNLLTTTTYVEVLRAAIDADAIEQYLDSDEGRAAREEAMSEPDRKKKEPASSATA